jgi:hypothetical protein
MNKSLFFLSFASILLSPFYADAKVIIEEIISVEETASEEIFSIGDEIKITAKLKNEFVGIGRKIFARTEVEGDFIGIGLNINFAGTANNDIYLAGNTINIEGIVNGSMTALGKSIFIKTPVGGNLRAGAEKIIMEGTVKGKTILWGNNISIKGEFNDLSLYANEISFAPDTVIYGDLTYTTPEKINLSRIYVRGDIQWSKPYLERLKETTPVNLLKRFYTFFSLLFPVMLMLGFFPNFFKQTASLSGKKFLPCFGTGLIFITITAVILPVIFITIVGAPLGLIIASFFFSSIYISRVFPSIFIGRMVLFKMKEKTLVWVLATIIGILLFTVISIHPTAKIVLNIISIPAGFGALFLGRLKLLQRLRKEKIL